MQTDFGKIDFPGKDFVLFYKMFFVKDTFCKNKMKTEKNLSKEAVEILKDIMYNVPRTKEKYLGCSTILLF